MLPLFFANRPLCAVERCRTAGKPQISIFNCFIQSWFSLSVPCYFEFASNRSSSASGIYHSHCCRP